MAHPLKTTEFHVVIPARYGSSRLPGKPLADLAGRPMIAHVCDKALASGTKSVTVATDDERIFEAVKNFGGAAEMTSPDHPSGTDRIAEVAKKRGWGDEEIVVNLQGDEPAIPSELISTVAKALASHPEASIATLATPIDDAGALFNPNVVKTVCDESGFALYFSRAPIPWDRDRFAKGPQTEDLAGGPYLRHIGMYAYRVQALRRLTAAPQAAIERIESLEQLRAMYVGLRIHVTVIEDAPGHGVDTEEDLERVRHLLRRKQS